MSTDAQVRSDKEDDSESEDRPRRKSSASARAVGGTATTGTVQDPPKEGTLLAVTE